MLRWSKTNRLAKGRMEEGIKEGERRKPTEGRTNDVCVDSVLFTSDDPD